MLCFACETEWEAYMFEERDEIVGISIAQEACDILWRDCRETASNLQAFRRAVFHAPAPVKQISAPFPRLEFLDSEASLCRFTLETIAADPMLYVGRPALPPELPDIADIPMSSGRRLTGGRNYVIGGFHGGNVALKSGDFHVQEPFDWSNTIAEEEVGPVNAVSATHEFIYVLGGFPQTLARYEFPGLR